MSPIDRARLSAELLKLRDSLAGTGLSPIARVQASARALAIRGQLGAPAPLSEGQAAFEKARQFYQENLKGQLIQSVVGPVSVNSTGWKKSKQGMKADVLKAKLIEHVREILETGTAGQRQESHKERNDAFVAFYFIQKQVRVDDLLVTAGVTVAEDGKGNLFYNISHADRESWKAYKNGAPDYAGVGPRSGDAANGMLDGLPQEQEPSAVGDTVADDDINITILAVVAVDPNAPAANDHGAEKPMVTGTLPQKNGGLLVMGDADALDAYAKAYLDQAKYTKAPTGLLLTKGQARMAQYLPSTQEILPSGAVLYSYAQIGGVSVAVDGVLSGIARDLADLKSLMAQEWGPDKFQAVFGEQAAAKDVQAYQDEQAAIAQRKQGNIDAAAQAKIDQQLAQDQEKARLEAAAVETARSLAEQEAEKQADFEKTIGAGKAENPIYQAYLDTLEELPTNSSNAGFLGWAGIRAGEFEKLNNGRVSANKEAYLAYVRTWADEHLSERVKKQRAAEPLTGNQADEFAANAVGFKTFSEYAARRTDKLPLEAFQVARAKYKIVEYLEQHGRADRNTLGSLSLQGANKEGPSALAQLRQDGYVLNNLRAQSNPFSLAPGITLATFVSGAAKPVPLADQGRAPAGGTIGMNGEFYKGGTILPNTTLPKGSSTTSTTGAGTQLVEPGVLAEPPEVGAIPVYGSRREFLVLQDGLMIADESKKDAMVFAYGKEGPAKVRAYAREYNTGRRWILPGEKIEPTEADQDPAPPAQTHSIIEYTTKKGKVLRGIIRLDLTLAEAKAIDPYTWRMNGGYFIREKHLDADTSAIQAAPAPTMLTAEQEAEKQERDTRAALERQQQAIASQVGKLREAGNKAIASGTEGMNADRKTNTHRRAGMAASAYARSAADEADGRTLNNIADSIEVGAAGPLANLTSRAQLQELKSALSRAKFDSERGLTYSEQLERRGNPVGEDALRHVSMPSRLVWSSRFKSAAMTLAKKAATGNSKLIAALNKMGDRTERWPLTNDGDIAITRKAYQVLGTIKDTWDLKDPMEMLARVERLKRMGITNDAQLQDACRALLPHMAAKQEESAVVKAERAIIGQKVGIDFFPTPAAEAQRMARKARISKGKRVLEPSAGNGNLADAAAAEGGEVDVIEISSQLRDILTLKGYNVVAHDFNTFTPDEKYDAILMNPPFSKRQDAEHIMRAYGMLAGGGTLVAIAGEGVFFGTDQKAVQFRAWLDSHNAEVEKLAGGTFQDNALLAQTSVSARMIVLHK